MIKGALPCLVTLLVLIVGQLIMAPRSRQPSARKVAAEASILSQRASRSRAAMQPVIATLAEELEDDAAQSMSAPEQPELAADEDEAVPQSPSQVQPSCARTTVSRRLGGLVAAVPCERR